MLALTKKTGYGLVAMGYLARLGEGQLASARQIATVSAVPQAILMNVLKELCTAGYVESVRGARGGYRLARRPELINLADLIAAIERPVRSSQCLVDENGDHSECSQQQMARCPITDPVHRVHRRLNDFLKKVTLAEIVEPSVLLAKEQAVTEG